MVLHDRLEASAKLDHIADIIEYKAANHDVRGIFVGAFVIQPPLTADIHGWPIAIGACTGHRGNHKTAAIAAVDEPCKNMHILTLGVAAFPVHPPVFSQPEI